MPTTAALIDRVCAEAKLNATAASADRALVLSWLQEAADRACTDAQVWVTSEASVTLTAGDPTYTLNATPFPTTMTALLDVSVTDSAVNAAPVHYITPHAMQGRRQGGSSIANGTPLEYSGDWPNFVCWPPPAASTTLTITYVAQAPTLADSATTITVMPSSFVWGCLYELAMWRALLYKKQRDEAIEHLRMYGSDRNAGLPGLRRWVASSMSRQGPTQSHLYSPIYSPSQDPGY